MISPCSCPSSFGLRRGHQDPLEAVGRALHHQVRPRSAVSYCVSLTASTVVWPQTSLRTTPRTMGSRLGPRPSVLRVLMLQPRRRPRGFTLASRLRSTGMRLLTTRRRTGSASTGSGRTRASSLLESRVRATGSALTATSGKAMLATTAKPGSQTSIALLLEMVAPSRSPASCFPGLSGPTSFGESARVGCHAGL